VNLHQLHFLDIQQQANSTVGLDDVRQLLLHVDMLETEEQRADDDDLKLRRLASLNQVTIKLIVVDFDMEKAN
jgi:hypothetical protein